MQQCLQQVNDASLDGLWVGAAEEGFELRALLLLALGHGSLATQGTVGEMVNGPASGADGQVGVERKILGELEGFEPVDNDWFFNGMGLSHAVVEEQAVASDAGEVAGDGIGGDS